MFFFTFLISFLDLKKLLLFIVIIFIMCIVMQSYSGIKSSKVRSTE